MTIGKKTWAIAEGYIPSESTGPHPQMTSHKTASILNATEEDAHVQIHIFYEDKDPVGPYAVTIPPKRTKHLRFNNLKEPEPIPMDTDYASVFISYGPIVVQHTRLDSRQAKNALLSTVAFA